MVELFQLLASIIPETLRIEMSSGWALLFLVGLWIWKRG